MYDNDLFEETEFLPIEVQKLLNDFSMLIETYENCQELKTELEKLGYTCDFGLDAIPINLRKI